MDKKKRTKNLRNLQASDYGNVDAVAGAALRQPAGY